MLAWMILISRSWTSMMIWVFAWVRPRVRSRVTAVLDVMCRRMPPNHRLSVPSLFVRLEPWATLPERQPVGCSDATNACPLRRNASVSAEAAGSARSIRCTAPKGAFQNGSSPTEFGPTYAYGFGE